MAKESKKKGERREHKQPWQEKYATPEEIKRMLDSRVSLRYNEVRRRTEIHYYSRGPSIREDEQGLLTIFGDDEAATDGYCEMGDRDVHGYRRYQVVRRSLDETRVMRQVRAGGDGEDGGPDS